MNIRPLHDRIVVGASKSRRTGPVRLPVQSNAFGALDHSPMRAGPPSSCILRDATRVDATSSARFRSAAINA